MILQRNKKRGKMKTSYIKKCWKIDKKANALRKATNGE